MKAKFVSNKEASRILGLHPNTLRYYADNGAIESFRTQRGHRRYNVESYLAKSKESITVCYCRVSGPRQRDELKKQVAFMREKYPQAEIIKDIGSGLNYKRRGLRALLERVLQGGKLKIVVVHKDRLARFGFDLIEWLVQQHGGEVIVLSQTDLSPEQELKNDLFSVLGTFASRLHGLKNYRSEINNVLSPPKEQTEDS